MCEEKAVLLHQGIASIQSGRFLCLESNKTDVSAAKGTKQWGQLARV